MQNKTKPKKLNLRHKTILTFGINAKQAAYTFDLNPTTTVSAGTTGTTGTGPSTGTVTTCRNQQP